MLKNFWRATSRVPLSPPLGRNTREPWRGTRATWIWRRGMFVGVRDQLAGYLRTNIGLCERWASRSLVYLWTTTYAVFWAWLVGSGRSPSPLLEARRVFYFKEGKEPSFHVACHRNPRHPGKGYGGAPTNLKMGSCPMGPTSPQMWCTGYWAYPSH